MNAICYSIVVKIAKNTVYQVDIHVLVRNTTIFGDTERLKRGIVAPLVAFCGIVVYRCEPFTVSEAFHNQPL